ncbi:MAG TPA: hypothetical protein VGX25_13600 [Actinophytocola sp.]|uniref:hypothetical protein n=1 Tax=Actinophytocola sp. TaxID=1872138 RepID=UPI002DDCC102|nr:hypothetical protein [Actinophytocola sp.]HEV2780419.1 hypothetical protein [Actinophytocola sp.]
MTEIRPAVATKTRTMPGRRFWLHFLEMVVAMVVGMIALAPVWDLAVDALGWSDLFDRPDLAALVMATNMTIAMTLLMRYHRHGWVPCAEMAAAMYIPFVVLFPPLWAGLLSGMTLMIVGHILMLPAMLAVMLWRREEYSMDHRAHRSQR